MHTLYMALDNMRSFFIFAHCSLDDCTAIFIQKYFTDMPPGLDTTETKILQQRRKRVLRIMSEMSVLDVARGKMEENEMTGLSTAGNTIGKKRKRNDSF